MLIIHSTVICTIEIGLINKHFGNTAATAHLLVAIFSYVCDIFVPNVVARL